MRRSGKFTRHVAKIRVFAEKSFENRKNSRKNTNFEGSKDQKVFCLVNTVHTNPCWHFEAKNGVRTPSELFNRQVLLPSVTVHEGL